MARRRKLGTAFMHAADNLTPIISNMFAADRERESADAATALAQLNASNTRTNDLWKRMIDDPMAAERFANAGVTDVNGYHPGTFGRTTEERLAPLMTRVLNNEHVAPGALTAGAAAAGADDPAKLDNLLKAATAQGDQRTADAVTAALAESHYDPNLGANVRKVGGQTIQLDPTGAQKGATEFDTWLGNAGNPFRLQTEAEQAGNVSYNTELGRLQPDLIRSRVDEANQKVQFAESQRSAADINTAQATTVGERSSAGNAIALMQAGADVNRIEASGARLSAPSISVATDVWKRWAADKIAEWTGFEIVNPAERAMATAAMRWTNMYGKMMSGVTLRMDERDNFLINGFPFAGDSVEEVRAKADFRAGVEAAAQAAAGRTKTEVGQILGRLVMQGRIDPNRLIRSTTFDPETLTAFMSVVPQVNR